MKEFRDQVAVITGAGSGIGRELALACAAQQARVVLCDRDQSGIEETADQARALGAEALAIVCDVSDAAAVDSAADEVYARFGACHLLFNNAGVLTGGPVWRAPVQAWRRCFDINVMGVVHALHSFVPRMIEAGAPAHIINTASAGGLISVGGFGVYAASKHAVVALSETLHHDLRAAGAEHIGVSVVCPAFVKTNITKASADFDLHGNADAAAHLDATREACESARLSAADVAALTLDGVRQGHFYILTHGGTRIGVQARMNDILENRQPSDPMRL